jgi:hypothetical protein
VLSVGINHLVKSFLLQACMSLFPTLAEYFMYSHLPYFLHIAAMPCCSRDEEYFDEVCNPDRTCSGLKLLLMKVLSAAV